MNCYSKPIQNGIDFYINLTNLKKIVYEGHTLIIIKSNSALTSTFTILISSTFQIVYFRACPRECHRSRCATTWTMVRWSIWSRITTGWVPAILICLNFQATELVAGTRGREASRQWRPSRSPCGSIEDLDSSFPVPFSFSTSFTGSSSFTSNYDKNAINKSKTDSRPSDRWLW